MYNIIINMWWMAQIDRMDYVYVLMEGQHQHVVDVQDEQDGQCVRAGQGGGQEDGVMMAEEWCGAVGKGGEQGQLEAGKPGEWRSYSQHSIQQADLRKITPIKRRKIRSGRRSWSLWWKMMEMEGVKEMMARRAKDMQHPISNFMRGGCSERISISLTNS